MLFFRDSAKMIDPERALPGRDQPMVVPDRHEVLGNPLTPPFPDGYEQMLKLFWEGHDPTQGMRQGNDVGTQYRSGIWVADERQRELAEASKAMFAERLRGAGYGEITTDIEKLGEFYYAEGYHQQYLAKNPNGYCGLGGTGVSCPVGITAA